MEKGQYETLVKLISDGFAAQDHIHNDILDMISTVLQELQTEVADAKAVHGRRLNKIERHIGLA